jgi:hypothetical protein
MKFALGVKIGDFDPKLGVQSYIRGSLGSMPYNSPAERHSTTHRGICSSLLGMLSASWISRHFRPFLAFFRLVKGVLNVYFGQTAFIPPEVEGKLFLEELLALRD